MRAELVLMGRRVDMAPRAHRQLLVMATYAGLAVLFAAFWMIDRWRMTGAFMFFATLLVNRLLLGGYNVGGLVRPFVKVRRAEHVPTQPLMWLVMQRYVRDPKSDDVRNDERELQGRDRAHFQAYQWLCIALILIWWLADFNTVKSASLMHVPVLAWIAEFGPTLLYGMVLLTIVLSQTLPQAILLWNEPDMEEFEEV